MTYKFHFSISIQLDTVEETRVIYQALCPEFEEMQFERSSTEISLNGDRDAIRIDIAAHDANAGRAAINMVLRWAKIGTEAVRILNNTKIGSFKIN